MGEKKELRGTKLTYAFFLAFSLLLFLIGILLTNQTESLEIYSRILFSLSAGFAVGGITGWINTYLIEREILSAQYQLEMSRFGESMRSIGIQDVKKDRGLWEIISALETAQTSICIVGSSLKGLIGAHEPDPEQTRILEILCAKIRAGVRVNILLAHPLVAGYREVMEDSKHGKIPTEILQNIIRIIKCFNDEKKTRDGKWTIRLYMCGPTVFSIEVDKRILFIQPYPLGGTSMDNLSIKAELSHGGCNYFDKFRHEHFHNAWEISEKHEIRDLEKINTMVKRLYKSRSITGEQQTALLKQIKSPGPKDKE